MSWLEAWDWRAREAWLWAGGNGGDKQDSQRTRFVVCGVWIYVHMYVGVCVLVEARD